ncbi:hypothetical protein QP162_13240 [Sphingomonas aurantiaca]|uniref:terminase gpP N-terminus-related DNA-binding protein n=1 Tax=Sphingomonas aurantiaca TaxID=185949 RepID=UPI002FE004D1
MSILADPLTLPVEERVRPARSLYWRGWSLAQIADEPGGQIRHGEELGAAPRLG